MLSIFFFTKKEEIILLITSSTRIVSYVLVILQIYKMRDNFVKEWRKRKRMVNVNIIFLTQFYRHKKHNSTTHIFTVCFITNNDKNYFAISCSTWLSMSSARLIFSYCHHLASVRKHFNLLLENHWSKWDQTWQECSFAWSNQVLLRSVIQHGCQGP